MAVKTLVTANQKSHCRFAIRGGGHTPWAGSSNIDKGVTIDLSLMSTTVYNKDQSTASVGPGSRWINVYEVLDQLGVSIPGGRAGSVGVAGLTLGGEVALDVVLHWLTGPGGNSFFAARYGLVCDNVVNYQVNPVALPNHLKLTIDRLSSRMDGLWMPTANPIRISSWR